MAAAAPPALTDHRQRELIAQELGLEDNAEFEAFLRGQWIKNAWYGAIHPELQFLYTKRAGIGWMLGRNWDKRDIKLADIQRKDGSLPKALQLMIADTQNDIDVLLARTARAAPPQSALITLSAGINLAGAVIGTGTLGGAAAGAVGGTITGGTAVTGTTPATLPENIQVYVIELLEGGFSQQVLPENLERTYLRLRNLSEGDLWYAFGKDATTGTPSIKLAKASGFYLVTGPNTPGDSVHVVGATTGQQFEVATD